MAQEIRPSLSPKTVLKGQLIYRLNFATLLSLPESEFARMIAEIEKDPFVQNLLYPKDPGLKILSKKRFPNSRLSSSFYEIDERVQASAASVDVQTLLSRHKGLVDLILRIGRDKFEKHFLYREGPETVEEAAEQCGITLKEAEDIQALLLDLSIQSEFFHPTSLPAEGTLRYTVVARIEQEHGKVVISYLSPHLAGGRYMISRERLDALKKTLTREDRKKLKEVLEKVEWINLRQDTLQKILSILVLRQNTYLRSGEPKSRVPISQRSVSKDLKVAPSTVSRSLSAKSVLLPWGEEKPLKDLFLSRKDAAERWVSELLEQMPPEEREKMSDARLRERLFRKYKLKASRRSVNLYRRASEKK